MSVILQRELKRLNGELLRLAELAEQAVRQALPALRQRDAALASAGVQGDDQIDREENHLNEECLRLATDLERIADLGHRLSAEAIVELVAAMKASPRAVQAGLSLFSVVRQLGRIADHAINIAEDVVYLVEGGLIRHRPEALAD
jgi:phosphate transport system protein